MKWRFAVACLLPLVLVLGMWGVWEYRQYRSFQTLVPEEATALIRIHADGLIKDIALNACWNWRYYDSTSVGERRSADLQVWRKMGASIPANLFLFQLEHEQKNAFPDTYFGSLRLTDTAIFSTVLRTYFGMQVSRNAQGKAEAFNDRAIAVYSDDRVYFALSFRKPRQDMHLLEGVLCSLLVSQNHVPVRESKFREINHLDGHISVLGKYRASMQFNTGNVSLEIMLPTGASQVATGSPPDFSQSNLASFWLNGLLGDWLVGKQFDLGEYVLHGDSLLMHYQGNMMLEWKGSIVQIDTVVSYDYDDEFNMREHNVFVEKQVPEVYLSVAATNAMLRYLGARGVVNLVDSSVNRAVFPLFQVYVSQPTDGYVQGYSAKYPNAVPEAHKRGDEVLFAQINFNKLDGDMLPNHMLPFIKLLSSADVRGRTVGDGQTEVIGKVWMNNIAINSLTQLLRLEMER